MKNTITTFTALDFVTLVNQEKIISDPICQRPPVSVGVEKSQGIIRSLINNFGIGMITLRDITEDQEMQMVYPGAKYLVIDGAHRVRALVGFYRNKFTVDKKSFNEMEELDYSDFTIPVSICVCSTKQSKQLFQSINSPTPVNWIEMVMCDEESRICKLVRSTTQYYKEYDNKVHPLFEVTTNSRGEKHCVGFENMQPNARRKWDEYVLMALTKIIGGGNIETGHPHMQELAETDPQLTKVIVDDLYRFLDDADAFRKHGKKFNSDRYAAFQMAWFGFYGLNKKFKIRDMQLFHKKFSYAYSKLAGHADRSLDTISFEFDGEYHFVKEFFRKNSKNMYNPKLQTKCFELLLEQMGEENGVVFRTAKRSLTSDERYERLALQGFVCALDGQPLKLEDSVWGHDTGWAEGGDLEDGAVIRKSHNTRMGGITLDQYRQILNTAREIA